VTYIEVQRYLVALIGAEPYQKPMAITKAFGILKRDGQNNRLDRRNE